MAKKNNNTVIIIVIIVVAVFALSKCEPEEEKPAGMVGARFVLDQPPLLPAVQTIVGGVNYADTVTGHFEVTVSNAKNIPVENVEFVGKSDDSGISPPTPFESATFQFDPVPIFDDQDPPITVSTSSFELEPYAVNNPGYTNFIFNFQYQTRDLRTGGLLSPVFIYDSVPIEIFRSYCPDGTSPFDAFPDHCTGMDKCVYVEVEHQPPHAIADQACCENYPGGFWTGTSCTVGCGGINPGECDDVPPPPPDLGFSKINTYCHPGSLQMVEDCSQCSAWDVYHRGNTNTDAVCEWDYPGEVTVSASITGTVDPNACTGGTWNDVGCSQGDCIQQMLQQYDGDPPGCTDDGITRCWPDGSCVTGGNVKFRTSSLTYSTSSAIAYGIACDGSALNRYGWSTGPVGPYSGICDITLDGVPSAIYLLDVPGGWFGGGFTRAYQVSSNIYICNDDGAEYELNLFSPTDNDRFNVDGSGVSIPGEESKEVACP